jgi:hypothetical protein
MDALESTSRLALCAIEVLGPAFSLAAPNLAAEIRYFSECVQRGDEPEPSGAEGLADVRVIEAVYRSLATKRTIELQPVGKIQRPNRALEQFVPPHGMPQLVDAAAPSR